MSFTYFLALPLDILTQKRLLQFPKRWGPFLNSTLYLSLIDYHHVPYLAKQLPPFPLRVEEWEKVIAHVSSLLIHTFLCPHISVLQLLACSQFQKLTLEELGTYKP
ncbi:hypothetical protein [Candidatus Chlamydia sanziniae]|uniref:Uncharacterized protein n=1 Tax=Candidatus Chlamydia sanziniae TaxID=1806891 RepID=A0A1A9HWW1_9CHLA|nr:hypothetical protein [Candidatus Chlamydia sanziniae]ANH78524.1 hypothetical protein Cs308_0353 [Candidatus Chlamydia sanziniae]